SFLLREDMSPSTGYTNAVFLTPDGGTGSWITNAGSTLAIGYFGSSSNNSNGNPMWSLQYNGVTAQSNVQVVQGAPALIVVSITFGATNQINMYVNPPTTSLGGSAPGTASATYSTTGSVAFESFAYLGGYATNDSSLADIRFGTTYAVVTPTAGQSSQTITFTPPTTPVTYGVSPIALSATATSGLPVTFSVLSGPGTVSGSTLTITGVGTVTVAANQAGNGSFSPAPQVTNNVVVNQASQTISFTPPTSPVTYGVSPITLSATATSGLPVVFTVSSGPGTISGNTLTITGTGTVVVAANQSGNSDYTMATQVTQSVVVNPALQSQTITFTAPTSPVTYGVSPIALSATASSGLTVTFSVVSGPGTVSGSTLAITGAGTVVVAANQAGNSTYSAAPQVTQNVVVNQASQTITFTAPTSPVTYGVSPISLSATATSGLAVTFTVSSGPGSISGSTLTVTGVGTIVVAASQAGNANYAAATQVTQNVVVNQASQTITFTAPTTPVTYGVSPITLSATASSGLAVTFTVSSGPGSISGSTLTVTGVGTIVVAASQAGNANYAAATQVTHNVVVNQASQTINFTAPTSPVTYGASPITLSATATSGLAVSFAVTSGPGTISGNMLTITGVGTVAVAASQTGNANYTAATPVTQNVVVNQAPQTINFTAPASPVTYPVSPITLSATATSGLTVSFTVTSGPGSVSGNTLTITGTGTVVVTASQAGNADYSAAPQVPQSIVVNAAGSGTLLAYEPFGETSGSTIALNGASGGGDSGWGAAWLVQNNSTEIPGYNIVSTNPLTYTGLQTTTNHAIGGYAYESVGRQLNVNSGGPFNSYLSGGLIGASGQTIWLSFLLRQDVSTSNGQTNAVYLAADEGAYAWETGTLGIGYFGSNSNSGGNPYWSLLINGVTKQSSAEVVEGTSTLIVVEITFGSTNVVNMYVNPPSSSLGGSAPATASASYSTTASLAFASLSYLGGYSTNESSLGDIRFGTTYAAVTP
ncbi:MAG: hypothetical protein ABR956_19130, partial [Terracidiphilus sp.]